MNQDNHTLDGIAIVGMAGRFPAANTLTQFWKNLRNGVDGVTTFTDDELELSPSDKAIAQNNPNYIKKGVFVEGADLFDAQFFGLLPKEVEVMDPQHRLFLECSWEAIEDAGYDPNRYPGAIGVFAACYLNTYLLSNLERNPAFVASLANSFHGGTLQTELGNDKDYLATRVAFKLNLRGPALTIQTACSSSLVAIAQACQNLLSYQCDMALAGGATLRFPQKRGYLYTEDGMVSPEGHCRTFDADARGTLFGNGVGVVLLKRLEDAIADHDSIYAVIKGWGLNNDGGVKYSYTAPSVAGQAEAIALAHALAGVDAESITYVEAHGTGTTLGDPIEIEALTKAFRATTEQNQFCAIGSLKSNIGHLDVAAGVAGLIKTSLALHHKQIPPTLHFENPNPKIDFPNTPFFVNTELRAWETNGMPRRAGLSSFGVGGTNAHVVLEEAPELAPRPATRPYVLLPLSAKSNTALDKQAQQLALHLANSPETELADIAYTLQQGRVEFSHRTVVVADSHATTSARLQAEGKPRPYNRVNQRNQPIVFMFPGQGSQHLDMGRELYTAEPVYRQALDRCAEILLPHLGFDLRDAIFADHEPQSTHHEGALAHTTGAHWSRPQDHTTIRPTDPVNQTQVAQPAIFATSYALAKLWMSWGIQPAAMIGHSVGEFVAATLAGVFALEDALMLIAARGRAMQAQPKGAMLSVRLSEEALLPYLTAEIDLAVVNSPTLCVVAGPTEAIRALQQRLEQEQVVARILHTSHAFHSWMMEELIEPFTGQVAAITLHEPQRPILSTVTGTWLGNSEATDPTYWAKHLRKTVRFAPAIAQLAQEETYIYLEVGPGQTLTTLARQNLGQQASATILSSLPHANQASSQAEHLTATLGKLWLAGCQIDWSAYYRAQRPRRVHLPTYPFERKRYWVEAAPLKDATGHKEARDATGDVTQGVQPLPPLHTPVGDSATGYSTIAQAMHRPQTDYLYEVDEATQAVIQQQLLLMQQQLMTWNLYET